MGNHSSSSPKDLPPSGLPVWKNHTTPRALKLATEIDNFRELPDFRLSSNYRGPGKGYRQTYNVMAHRYKPLRVRKEMPDSFIQQNTTEERDPAKQLDTNLTTFRYELNTDDNNEKNLETNQNSDEPVDGQDSLRAGQEEEQNNQSDTLFIDEGEIEGPDASTLSGSNTTLQEVEEKKYDPLDTTLKFVQRPDDLDPVSSGDDTGLRAEMSCGHAVSPDSLTEWCKSLLNQGKYKFRCPALVEGTKQCKKRWSYKEVRRLAALSPEEMEYFESTVARLAAADYCDMKPCPGCRSNLERKDLANLRVRCTICTADRKKTYDFCWQCLREWKGSGSRSDRCDNDGCTNNDLQLLQTCRSISLPDVEGVTDCPSVRACPTCGMMLEHSRANCKNVYCPRCHVQFCFVCLKLKRACNKTSSPYEICPTGVAPRQTSMPVWHRK